MNAGGFGSGVSNSGFSTNTNMEATANFGINQSFATTPNSAALPILQNQTLTSWSYNEPQTMPTPWSNPEEQISPVPWHNNQNPTQWSGNHDLSSDGKSSGNTKQIDYSLYGDGFSREFIDQMLNDARFQKIIRYRTQGNEGGYSNSSNDRGGETPLHIMAQHRSNYDCMELLIAEGSNVDAQDNDGWTPLMNAVNHPQAIMRKDVIPFLSREFN